MDGQCQIYIPPPLAGDNKYTVNILHINSTALGFRGWGYFCDQIVFAESQDFDRYSSKYMAICLHHKTGDERVMFA